MTFKKLVRFLAKEEGYTLETLSAKCGYHQTSGITRGLYDDSDWRFSRVKKIVKGLNADLVLRMKDGEEFKID